MIKFDFLVREEIKLISLSKEELVKFAFEKPVIFEDSTMGELLELIQDENKVSFDCIVIGYFTMGNILLRGYAKVPFETLISFMEYFMFLLTMIENYVNNANSEELIFLRRARRFLNIIFKSMDHKLYTSFINTLDSTPTQMKFPPGHYYLLYVANRKRYLKNIILYLARGYKDITYINTFKHFFINKKTKDSSEYDRIIKELSS